MKEQINNAGSLVLALLAKSNIELYAGELLRSYSYGWDYLIIRITKAFIW